MAEQAGDTEAEPDRSVRPNGPKRICSDETKERRQSQRAEDEPDETAQQPDHRPGRDDRTRARRFLARRPSRRSPRTKQVDPEDEQRHADRDQERIGRHLGGNERADHGPRHRRRRHPGEQAPIDAACADVGHGSREGGQGRDPNVRPGPRRRARGRKDDDREADVPQNEANEAARKRSGEAPESDGDEDKGVQSLEYPR